MPVDLESLFASVYTLRLPIAVGTIVVMLLVALFAVRRRWDRVALRHPAATAAAVIVLLVVAVPAGWYLASPLFVSTELIEPVPVAVASPTADASASTDAGGTASSVAASPSPTAAASGPSAQPSRALATETRGRFSGTDDFHFGRGTARLIVETDGSAILRLEDFAVRNGPDLFVYLSPSKSRYTKNAIELGRLKADRGSFNYRIPAGTDLSRVMSAVIWCKQFSFQFAVAPLS